jgi:hypothetical protein
MASQILDYIVDYIKDRNQVFNSFGVNGIQLPGGEVIEFTDGVEKKFIGIGDNFGTAGYIRFNTQINHNQPDRRLSSSRSGSYLKSCRLVAFTFKREFASEDMMTKLITDLKSVPFTGMKSRPQIIIRKSNHNYLDIVKDELKKDFTGAEFACVAIDFDLRYYADSCDECSVFNPDDKYVKIAERGIPDHVIARKLPPQTYYVDIFDTINGGMPDTEYELVIIPEP